MLSIGGMIGLSGRLDYKGMGPVRKSGDVAITQWALSIQSNKIGRVALKRRRHDLKHPSLFRPQSDDDVKGGTIVISEEGSRYK